MKKEDSQESHEKGPSVEKCIQDFSDKTLGENWTLSWQWIEAAKHNLAPSKQCSAAQRGGGAAKKCAESGRSG